MTETPEEEKKAASLIFPLGVRRYFQEKLIKPSPPTSFYFGHWRGVVGLPGLFTNLGLYESHWD